MAKYSLKEITNKNSWENFVLSKTPGSFLQSWNWGEVNSQRGSRIFRLGFYKDGKIVGVCLAIREDAKRGPHLIVPGGPIMDWKDKKLVKYFIEQIKGLAKKENVWFVRVRPEILDTPENRKLFKSLGFLSAPMHLHAENTWVLEIAKSDEELLKGMRKTTRYLVKKGEKENLSLEISHDPKCSSELYKLQKKTIERHKFVGFPKALFETEIRVFGEDNTGEVFICRLDRKILAMAIIIFYGNTAYYHFSGSVSDLSKIPFSYFLQWKVIKEARRRGMKYYNFWGIAPNGDTKHRFAGVTLFKTGFGGERIDWLHAHDMPVSKKYWLTYLFEKVRKNIRHL